MTTFCGTSPKTARTWPGSSPTFPAEKRYASRLTTPSILCEAATLKTNLRKAEQYQDNLSSGLRQARLAQEATDEIIERLVDVKATGHRRCSQTRPAPMLRASMAERNQENIRDTMVASAEHQVYGDRFLFGRHQFRRAAFCAG